MEEIKVGEYVRTENGIIGKLIREDLSYPEPSEWILDVNGERIVIVEAVDYPVKHSFNIIYLIEIGDFVNGYVVLDIVEDIETGEIHLEMPVDYTNKELGDCTIYNKDIYEVLTREQYENNCYRLENKDEVN